MDNRTVGTSTGGSKKRFSPRDLTIDGIKTQLHETFSSKDNNPVLGLLTLFETYVPILLSQFCHTI